MLHPNQAYAPMSFGPLGRNWAQRACYAGTYDANWQENIFPFLPTDFDERYFQSAPADQQLDVFHGGQSVSLLNLTHPALTPSGRLDFALPDLGMTARCEYKNGVPGTYARRADTLLLEPDKQRFCVVWQRDWLHSIGLVARSAAQILHSRQRRVDTGQCRQRPPQRHGGGVSI